MNHSDNVVHIYGITKDSKRNDLMMVMQYAKHGNLRQKLNRDFNSLDWGNKLKILHDIAKGLRHIHEVGLIHRDFHCGNILNGDDNFGASKITDLGLCKPANERSEEHNKTVY